MRYIWLLTLCLVLLFSFTVQAQSVPGDGPGSGRANFVPYMVDDPELCPTPGLATKNQDIHGLWQDLSEQMLNMALSESANLNEIKPVDQARINGYIAALESAQVRINTEPAMDYAGTHTLYFCLLEIDNSPVVTSNLISQLLVIWTRAAGELLRANSSHGASGLSPDDNERFSESIAAMKNYMAHVDRLNTIPAGLDKPKNAAVTSFIERSSGITRIQRQ